MQRHPSLPLNPRLRSSRPSSKRCCSDRSCCPLMRRGVSKSKSRGRRGVARKNIEAGALLIEEAAIGWIVKAEIAHEWCAVLQTHRCSVEGNQGWLRINLLQYRVRVRRIIAASFRMSAAALVAVDRRPIQRGDRHAALGRNHRRRMDARARIERRSHTCLC